MNFAHYTHSVKTNSHNPNPNLASKAKTRKQTRKQIPNSRTEWTLLAALTPQYVHNSFSLFVTFFSEHYLIFPKKMVLEKEKYGMWKMYEMYSYCKTRIFHTFDLENVLCGNFHGHIIDEHVKIRNFNKIGDMRFLEVHPKPFVARNLQDLSKGIAFCFYLLPRTGWKTEKKFMRYSYI